MNIDQLPGLTSEQVASVKRAGIRTCRQLLRYRQSRSRMQDLAGATGLPLAALQSIVQRAELTEVRGIGPVALANLLEAGILGLADLAAQEPLALQSRLWRKSTAPPNLAVIEHWILQARRRAARSSAVART